MAAPRHVLETYINASAERIWDALIDPEQTAKYFFGCRLTSDLTLGSVITYDGADGTVAVRGEVVECVAPQRLVMTFTVQWDETARAEVPSKVTWEITPVGSVCRVTCIHGDLARSPRTYQLTASGWPLVLAGFKSVVETGDGLGEVPDDGGSPFSVADHVDRQWHRSLAVDANNGVYPLLAERLASGPVDANADDRLIHQAHAAAHHWRIVGEIEQWAMAEYLCSRVYAFIGRAEPALHHAARCTALMDEIGLGDWQRAYALEASARALACAGRSDEARAALNAALEIPIADPEDGAIVIDDINTGPWYGAR
jgi:uncharacterized protein YndB with AHSA1/START domain